VTSDKAYATEQRLGAVVNALAGGGGVVISFLTSDAAQCNTTGTGQATGLSVPVLAGVSYWFEADCVIANQSTNTVFLGMMGPAMTTFGAWFNYGQLGSAASGTAGDAFGWSGIQATVGTGFPGSHAATISGETMWVHVQGRCIPSAGGNLSINNASSAAVASFTTKQMSVLRLYPQTGL
jgi:hypothetical protein